MRLTIPGSFRGSTTQLIVGFSLLATIIATTTWLFTKQEGANELVRHTLDVEDRLSRAFSLLQDAETGQRGYLLAVDERFLAPYQAAVAELGRTLDGLEAATADNPSQQRLLSDLKAVAKAKIAELDATIDHQQNGDAEAALAMVRSGRGKALMDRTRAIVASLRLEEENLLAARQIDIQRSGRWLSGGAALIISMVTILGGLAVREAERRTGLSRFLPAEIAPLLAEGDPGLRRGRRQNAATMFVDIRGSTALAEGMDPPQVAIFLSSFRRRVTRAAAENGGLVDKFIGDGAMLVFGVPSPQPDDAARALASASRLLELIERWNAKRSGERAVSIIRVGIGVHYGEVFCGIIGEDKRLEFTVLGDSVNVASRLEQATKHFNETLLVSGAVLDAAGEGSGWCEVACDPLPGRSEALPIFASRPGLKAV